MNATDATLMRFLAEHHGVYHARALELRSAVTDWLSYIPATFPHYTRHTVGHSDEIVAQASQLLFREDDPGAPVVGISPAEAYVLVASAYLHDAGMVVSEGEQLALLGSDSWSAWIADNPAAESVSSRITVLLDETDAPADDHLRAFLVGREMRFLLAAFLRNSHHQRVTGLLTQDDTLLGQCTFGDPILQRTIGDVCVGHGLTHHALEDSDRYPDVRDVRGEPVNVRFTALILRLADLLDLSHDRACPLLLNAASPLPPESVAHWGQYERVVHRRTDPDRIEVTAECETQSEHRHLADWCQWIVEETAAAGVLMARSSRHGEWRPPSCSVGPNGTICIRPAPQASYLPYEWRFSFDRDEIFRRLIYDVNTGELDFVRELLQNALDASRCQLYADLREAGIDPPVTPDLAPVDWRERFSISVRLTTEAISNDLTGDTEDRQVVVIEDQGIGMNQEDIQSYLLQIGRSYYSTESFRRSFHFAPTSRFGVGFLSIFAVSDNIVVETRRVDSDSLRLTLTGPRSYLLTERGPDIAHGTRIEIRLRKNLSPDRLMQFLRSICTRIEFPVLVDELGQKTTLRAEADGDWESEQPIAGRPGQMMGTRSIPFSEDGISGSLYVFFTRDEDQRESWANWNWASTAYPLEHPDAIAPTLPGSVACLHGIRAGGPGSWGSDDCTAYRIDVRAPINRLGVTRQISWQSMGNRDAHSSNRFAKGHPTLERQWRKALRSHLDSRSALPKEEAWRYKQALISYFNVSDFWHSEPETVRLLVDGHFTYVDLLTAEAAEEIVVIAPVEPRVRMSNVTPADLLRWGIAEPAMMYDDLERSASLVRHTLFNVRYVTHAVQLDSGLVALRWKSGSTATVTELSLPTREIWSVPLPDSEMACLAIHRTTDLFGRPMLLNPHHPFGDWLSSLAQISREKDDRADGERLRRVAELVHRACLDSEGLEVLEAYLERWRSERPEPSSTIPGEFSADWFSALPQAFSSYNVRGTEAYVD